MSVCRTCLSSHRSSTILLRARLYARRPRQSLWPMAPSRAVQVLPMAFLAFPAASVDFILSPLLCAVLGRGKAWAAVSRSPAMPLLPLCRKAMYRFAPMHPTVPSVRLCVLGATTMRVTMLVSMETGLGKVLARPSLARP